MLLKKPCSVCSSSTITLLLLIVLSMVTRQSQAYEMEHVYTYEYETSVSEMSVAVNSSGTRESLRSIDHETKMTIGLECISLLSNDNIGLFSLFKLGNNNNDEFLFEMDLKMNRIVKVHSNMHNNHRHKYTRDEQEESLKSVEEDQENLANLIDLLNSNFNINDINGHERGGRRREVL